MVAVSTRLHRRLRSQRRTTLVSRRGSGNRATPERSRERHVPRLVFMGGVSGVGKSTLLQQVPGRGRVWTRMSASQLIADELGATALPIEGGADVERYQDALLRAYQRKAALTVLPI